MFKLVGKMLLFLAMLTFITGASLFVVGAYVLTWPALRLSPRDRRRQAFMQLGLSLFTLAQAFAPDPPENSRPSPPQSTP